MENIGNGFIVVEKSGNYEKFSQEDSEHFYKNIKRQQGRPEEDMCLPLGRKV